MDKKKFLNRDFPLRRHRNSRQMQGEMVGSMAHEGSEVKTTTPHHLSLASTALIQTNNRKCNKCFWDTDEL